MKNLLNHHKEVADICAKQWEQFYSKFHLSELATTFEALAFMQPTETYEAHPRALEVMIAFQKTVREASTYLQEFCAEVNAELEQEQKCLPA